MINEKKFLAIYDEFMGSGLTIRDFCANQQINEAKFYYWQNKLKGQLPPKRGFVPVVFENGQQTRSLRIPAPVQPPSAAFSTPEVTTQTISCEISYPNGVLVKLNGLPDAQILRSLLVLTRRYDVQPHIVNEILPVFVSNRYAPEFLYPERNSDQPNGAQRIGRGRLHIYKPHLYQHENPALGMRWFGDLSHETGIGQFQTAGF